MNQHKLPTRIKSTVKRDTRFKKGNNANPKGRPIGSGVQGELRKKLNQNLPEILDKLLELARGGDLGALRILIDKGLGSRKNETYIDLDIPENLSIAQKVDFVIDAAVMGEIATESAGELAKAAVLANTLKDTEIGSARVIELNLGQLVAPDLTLEVKEPKMEIDNG
jgi:hypothetical protein